jgi:hypothetical protein
MTETLSPEAFIDQEYWGGVLDDGFRFHIKTINQPNYPLFKPLISISDPKRPALMKDFRERFGNPFPAGSPQDTPTNWLSHNNETSLVFLDQAIPLFVVQRPEAELMRGYIRRRIARQSLFPPYARYKEDHKVYTELNRLITAQHDKPFTASLPRLAGSFSKGGSVDYDQETLFMVYESVHLALIEAMQEGLNVDFRRTEKPTTDGKINYCLTAENEEAYRGISTLLPFARHIREQAENSLASFAA